VSRGGSTNPRYASGFVGAAGAFYDLTDRCAERFYVGFG